MPTAILVHGGFHGGWCWQKVSNLLVKDGWAVYAPSLTGLGDRAHLLAPSIGPETHVQDIVGIIENEELNGVVLCGHSAGGTVVTVVADRLPERIGHLVYLDAVVPKTYIRCERFDVDYGERMVGPFERDPGWHAERWDSVHDVMITEPEKVHEVLLRA